MKTPDAFRAQYYLGKLEKEILRMARSLSPLPMFATPLPALLTNFSSNLVYELDQLILPTIVFELQASKEAGLLIGSTGSERYTSFFVEGSTYTINAKNIISKYPFLFELMDDLIIQTFDALNLCLKRYCEDQSEIDKWLGFSQKTSIATIQPLGSADRHRRQLAIVITFLNGKKIIYKPVDLTPDILFKEFIHYLELDQPYDIRSLNVLPRDEYGWMEFIDHEACNTIEEVQNFYRRSGVLLAVTDALNYTDGHYENLIAYREFPILLDNETLFQNYEESILDQKNILSTMLIQKITGDPSEYLNSALQAPPGPKFENLHTHAINDHTDDIEIRYTAVTSTTHHHSPSMDGISFNSSNFAMEVVEGYCYAYERISNKKDDILNNTEWWDRVSTSRARIVIRETMTYAYLLRKMQQPEYLSKAEADKFLRSKLGETPYTENEMKDLLSLNVPYFYHSPGEKNLYDARGHKYDDVFHKPAVEGMKKMLLNLSEEKKLFNCKIISRHLDVDICSNSERMDGRE